jgi:tetratricopeptide (TPR) repeat protein
VEYCERALAVHLGLGEGTGQSETWDSLGFCHHHLGHLAEAQHAYRQGARLFAEYGDTHNQALCLVNLGAVYLDAGEPQQAREPWRTALGILEGLGHPEAGEVRARLMSLPPGDSTEAERHE